MSGKISIRPANSSLTITGENRSQIALNAKAYAVNVAVAGVQGIPGVGALVSDDPTNELINTQNGLYSPQTQEYDPGDLAALFLAS